VYHHSIYILVVLYYHIKGKQKPHNIITNEVLIMNINVNKPTAERIKKMALTSRESYDEILNRKFDEMSKLIKGEGDDI